MQGARAWLVELGMHVRAGMEVVLPIPTLFEWRGAVGQRAAAAADAAVVEAFGRMPLQTATTTDEYDACMIFTQHVYSSTLFLFNMSILPTSKLGCWNLRAIEPEGSKSYNLCCYEISSSVSNTPSEINE